MKPARLPSPSPAAAAFVLAVVLGSSGCHRDHDLAEDHDHADEPVQFTVWSERYELFGEYPRPVAGEPASVVLHVTDLRTSEPRRDGPLTIQIAIGRETPVEYTSPSPTRPGIYQIPITFPRAGDWTTQVQIPSPDGEAVVALPAVTVFGSRHDAQHAESPPTPEGITFLKEQQWLVQSRSEPIARRQLVERLRVPATVTARPGSQAVISTPFAGRFHPAPGQPTPLLGDMVAAGQTIAVIQPMASDLARTLAEAASEETRARLAVEQAEATLKRTEALAQAQAKSTREAQDARFALQSAQARLEAARAVQSAFPQIHARLAGDQLPVPVVELKSPIAGRIVAQDSAAPGEWISPDRPLFTVLDPRVVFIEARVPESTVNRLGDGRNAVAEVPGELGGLIPITAGGRGRAVFLSPRVDSATRTVTLVYEADNGDGRWRIGQQLSLHVETRQATDALAIPGSALVEEGGRFVAFVQTSGETFERRDLRLGIRDGEWVQVLAGLSAGDRVVTRGAYAIRLSAASSVIPAHGHSH